MPAGGTFAIPASGTVEDRNFGAFAAVAVPVVAVFSQFFSYSVADADTTLHGRSSVVP